MSFNSLSYVFIFLPLAIMGYYLLRRTGIANLFMTCASLFFYAVSAVWYLIPLFVTAFVDYFIGQKIFDSSDDRYRKRLLVLSVVTNLALLSVFKYAGWLSNDLSALFALFGVTISTFSITLPPAISFYTFQSMSYTIDIYRREFKPYRNAVDYISFVSFFPHLVAGPIMRARDLLPQLANRRPLPSNAAVSAAFFMILFGLFQKTVVADNVGGMVELIVQMMEPSRGPLPPGVGFLFMYGFAFQIYCDFAAYSTIARGSAALFNVKLMRNFLTPYFAANPSDFWQRWHISLSTWLRDYLYIPLGGSQSGKLMTIRNLMLTMLLGGLWHGAGFFFVLWGLYHGLLLVLYRLVPIDAFLVRAFGKTGKVVAIVLFFHLVCVGWIFFRATPEQFHLIWGSIFAFPQFLLSLLVGPGTLSTIEFMQSIKGMGHGLLYGWGILLFTLPVLITDLIAFRKGVEFPDLFAEMSTATKIAVILLLLYGIQFFGRRESNEFIYFAF